MSRGFDNSPSAKNGGQGVSGSISFSILKVIGLAQLDAVQGKTEKRSESYYEVRRVSLAGLDAEMRRLRKS